MSSLGMCSCFGIICLLAEIEFPELGLNSVGQPAVSKVEPDLLIGCLLLIAVGCNQIFFLCFASL